MQKLGRHEYLLLSHIVGRLAPRTVVLGLETIVIRPGVEYDALLGVESLEDRFQLEIKAALVAVAPEDDGRVIDIAGHHLLHHLRTHHRLVGMVPAGLLTFHIEPQ